LNFESILNDRNYKHLQKFKTQNSKVKMIVAQQKFLKEIFAEHPKFYSEPHRGSGQPRTELCSGTGLHFAF